MLREHLPAKRILFNLPNRAAKPGAFKAEFEPAD